MANNAAMQHPYPCNFFIYETELINIHRGFHDDKRKKRAVSVLTTEFREETRKLLFGALQYMEVIRF